MRRAHAHAAGPNPRLARPCLGPHPQTLKSTHAMGEAMAGATKAMAAMNRRMNLPAVAKIMREFEKQNERMEMTSEMMGDAGGGGQGARGVGRGVFRGGGGRRAFQWLAGALASRLQLDPRQHGRQAGM